MAVRQPRVELTHADPTARRSTKWRPRRIPNLRQRVKFAILSEAIDAGITKSLRESRVEALPDCNARRLSRPTLLVAKGADGARRARRRKVVEQGTVWHMEERGMRGCPDGSERRAKTFVAPRTDRFKVQVAVAYSLNANATSTDEPERLANALLVRNVWPERYAKQWHAKCGGLAHDCFDGHLLVRNSTIGGIEGRE